MKKSEMEAILKQIKFEQDWLHDVLKEDGKISDHDIVIAMSGIRGFLMHMRVDEVE